MSDDRFARYRELLARIDEHAARVVAEHGDALRCRLGCTACCRQDLHVSQLEADHIRAWLAGRALAPPDASLTEHDAHSLFDLLSGQRPCVFLGAGGACQIYEVRPIICRTHGLPVELDADDDDFDSDEVVRDVCPLNFAEHADSGYATIEAGAVLDLERLNVLLAMLDRLDREESGAELSRTALSTLRAEHEDG